MFLSKTNFESPAIHLTSLLSLNFSSGAWLVSIANPARLLVQRSILKLQAHRPEEEYKLLKILWFQKIHKSNKHAKKFCILYKAEVLPALQTLDISQSDGPLVELSIKLLMDFSQQFIFRKNSA